MEWACLWTAKTSTVWATSSRLTSSSCLLRNYLNTRRTSSRLCQTATTRVWTANTSSTSRRSRRRVATWAASEASRDRDCSSRQCPPPRTWLARSSTPPKIMWAHCSMLSRMAATRKGRLTRATQDSTREAMLNEKGGAWHAATSQYD